MNKSDVFFPFLDSYFGQKELLDSEDLEDSGLFKVKEGEASENHQTGKG